MQEQEITFAPSRSEMIDSLAAQGIIGAEPETGGMHGVFVSHNGTGGRVVMRAGLAGIFHVYAMDSAERIIGGASVVGFETAFGAFIMAQDVLDSRAFRTENGQPV